MRNILDYRLVTEETKLDMEREVQEYLEEGFQPFGGTSVCIALQPHMGCVAVYYSQAMVKYVSLRRRSSSLEKE